MSETYALADWHLGEDRFELMGRPFTTQEEMIDALIKNHNAKVKPDDFVYVLGDVCYQKQPHFLSYVEKFNGIKTLVRGNHDRVISNEDFLKYFNEVVDEGAGIELDVEGIPCYLTHYPTEGRADRFNIVGHIHAAWKYQLNMFNVGVDVNHFRPVNLKTIPFHFKAVCDFYDADCWAAYSHLNEVHKANRGKKSTYFRSK